MRVLLLPAALEALRRHPCCSANGSCDRPNQCRRAHLERARSAVDRRICVRRRCQMNRNRLERTHLPHDSFFCAAHAGNSGSDWPYAGNLVEMPRCASGVRHRPLAAQFVEAPALAMSFIAECKRESSCIEVRAPRAILVDHSVVGEFRTVQPSSSGSRPWSRTRAPPPAGCKDWEGSPAD